MSDPTVGSGLRTLIDYRRQLTHRWWANILFVEGFTGFCDL